MKRLLAFFAAMAFSVSALAGCAPTAGSGAAQTPAGAGVKESIRLLNSKGEIQSAMENIAKQYQEETGVKIEIVAAPSGGSPFEKIMSMYGAGEPPTLAMLDTPDVLALYRDKALDLSEEKWVPDAGGLVMRIDGKVFSFPMGIEGKGLIYNKTVLDQTLSEPFDPQKCNTRSKLKAVFDELAAKGVTPMIISKEDWSLGAHYIGLIYESQADSTAQCEAFTEQLCNGNVRLMENSGFKDVLDTFDMLKEYNINRRYPLAADYVVDPLYLADGDGAFWFNGTWAWANLKEFVEEGNEDAYGFMPIPLNDDETAFTNNNFIGAGSKQVMIDKVSATQAQQQAAKEFLNWLVYDPQGQEAMVVQANLVPPFQNITVEPPDPLAGTLKDYIEKNRIIIGPTLPSDHWSVIGAYMQQYLADKMSREQVAAGIEKYWQGKSEK